MTPGDPPPFSNVRLVRYATGWGHTPTDFARALGAGTATALKTTAHPTTGERFVCVYRTTLSVAPPSKRAREQGSPPEPVTVVVKINPLPTLGKRVRCLLKGTKHHRQWRGAERLERAGLHAARPLALLRAATPQGEAEVLLLEHVEGKTLLEVLAQRAKGTPLPKRLRAALSEMVVGIESHRLWNRDPKPSNLVLRSEPGKPLRCVLLDTVGVERKSPRHPSEEHAFLRHLIAMILLESRGSGHPPPPKFAAKLATYAIFESENRGWRKDRTLDLKKARKKAKKQAAKLVREVEKQIAGRPSTPTDSPLPPPPTPPQTSLHTPPPPGPPGPSSAGRASRPS